MDLKEILKKIKIIRIATVLLFVLVMIIFMDYSMGEIARSTVPLQAMKPDPDLLWRFNPHLKNYPFRYGGTETLIRTNSYGLRSKEIDEVKTKRHFRILCLGDEVTFGAGIPQLETYPELLGDIIQRRYHYFLVDTINAGIPGYSSFQGRRMFDQLVSVYEPDMVILGFMYNDISKSTCEDKFRVPDNELSLSTRRFLYQSNTFMFFRNWAMGQIMDLQAPDKDSRGSLRVSAEDYFLNICHIVKVCGETRPPVTVIGILMPEDHYRGDKKKGTQSDVSSNLYRSYLMKAVGVDGYWFDANVEVQYDRSYFLEGNTRLLNEKGHQLFANKLFKVVEDYHLVPQEPTAFPSGGDEF